MTEKMSLVNIVGPVSSFDEVAMCCVERKDFHAVNALTAYDFGTDYAPFTDQNPYSESLKQIVEFASRANINLKYSDFSGLDKTPDEIVERISGISENFNIFIDHISEQEKRIAEDNQILIQLEHLKNISISLENLLNFEFVRFRFGRLTRDSYDKMNAYARDDDFFFIPTSIENEYVWGLYFTALANHRKVDTFFNTLSFERVRLSGRVSGTPKQAIINFKNELYGTNQELAFLKKQFDEFMREATNGLLMYYSKIRALSDVFDLRKFAARSTQANVRQSFLMAGWVPASEAPALCERIELIIGVSCIIESPEENAALTPPTKLKNIGAVKPFEDFVKLYGLPSYNETDPSPIFAFTYTLIFGIMFGDLGQGFILFLAGLFATFKMKKTFGQILSSIGISSMVFGCIYGSVFGFEDVIKGIISPMENINFMLISAVAIGTVLVAMVMLLNIRNGFHQKEFAKALFSSNGAAGLIFYCSIIVGAAFMLLKNINIFNPIYIIAFIVAPLILFVLREPLDFTIRHKSVFKPEKLSDFIIETFFEVFEILLSFTTNTISFIRIGAFALSHAGMMMIVLTLAGATSGSANPIVMVVGNLFVMCFEGVIVGIQVLRLEFYEMFSRFYDGNGEDFTPVTIHYENN